jgi:hypothetical protein
MVLSTLILCYLPLCSLLFYLRDGGRRFLWNISLPKKSIWCYIQGKHNLDSHYHNILKSQRLRKMQNKESKFVPLLQWRHTGTANLSLHTLLTSALHEGEWSASWHTHFTQGRSWCYPLNRRLGGPSSWSESFWDEVNLSPLAGFERQTIKTSAWSLYCLSYPGTKATQ